MPPGPVGSIDCAVRPAPALSTSAVRSAWPLSISWAARRLAQICGADPDEFSVLAGHLPEDVRGILYRQPKDAVAMLRERFAPYHSHSENNKGKS